LKPQEVLIGQGFAVGPLIWGPFSELYGRTIPLFFGFAIFAIFQVPVAVAQNLHTILICRFFGGLFGCAPLAIVGGALADFWDPVDRGIAICLFSAATFIGPVAGPIVGGFITMSYLGWRWTAWITLIMAALFWTIGLILVPETYAPVLLQRRAKKIRYETKNWAIHAKADENKVDFHEIIVKYLFRPLTMLILEPILIFVTLHMSVIYGILYLFFTAYPISFQEERMWNAGVGALPFLGITIGVLIGGTIIAIVTKTRFARKLKENGKVIPEERLPPMIVGAALLPCGLFWFAVSTVCKQLHSGKEMLIRISVDEQPTHHLDTAGTGWYSHRCWYPHDLHAGFECKPVSSTSFLPTP